MNTHFWIDSQSRLDAYRRARRLLCLGEHAKALALLDDACAHTPEPVLDELRARTRFACGQRDLAENICREALSRAPDNGPLHSLLGQLCMEAGRTAEAHQLFARVAASPRPTDEALLNLHALDAKGDHDESSASGDTQKGCGVVVTSLPPGNDGLHRACVGSWIRNGLRVLSLNAADELPALENSFPEVTFVPARRDAREEVGKPCVYVDDMLALLAEQPEALCGIINADILLRPDGLGHWLSRQAEQRLVFGSRADVDTARAAGPLQGRMYSVGFDYFFFPRSMATSLNAHGIALGTPWWDYLLPLSALGQQRRAGRVVSPVALHARHSQNWRLTQGWKNGMRVLEALMPENAGLLLGNMDMEHHNEGYAQTMAGFGVMLSQALNTAPDRLVCALAGEVTAPFDAEKTAFPFPTLRVSIS